jgi:peptidoglycan/LPS O-acetylase OafA/YrhL
VSASAQAGRGFHLPSLDGIRALAALMVFASHAGMGHVSPGGFGVTIFFFLSGYLITTLMRREFEQTGRLDLGAFYLRRVYRILPPLYLVLAVIAVISLMFGWYQMTTIGGVISLLLQYSNYFILEHGGNPLLPATGTFWSLAIEEHFYLVFPLLYLWAARRFTRQGTALIFVAICVAALTWRCILIFALGADSDRTYLATDTRIDSLLFGCIMGVWMNPALDAEPFSTRRSKFLMLSIGLLLLLAGFAIRDEGFRSTLRYTLQGIGLFPLFWLVVRHPEWPLFRVLNTAPARLLGAISYVFYLSHLLWLSVANTLLTPGPLAAAVALLLTLIFSYIVYRTVELPFARLRHRMHARRTSAPPVLVKKGQA